uniref:Uncharacterized protein n=1 Tax=Glossina austeni TaxID=7395 RepID=A0A1A9UXD3_GLOAU
MMEKFSASDFPYILYMAFSATIIAGFRRGFVITLANEMSFVCRRDLSSCSKMSFSKEYFAFNFLRFSSEANCVSRDNSELFWFSSDLFLSASIFQALSSVSLSMDILERFIISVQVNSSYWKTNTLINFDAHRNV